MLGKTNSKINPKKCMFSLMKDFGKAQLRTNTESKNIKFLYLHIKLKLFQTKMYI